MTIMNFGPMRLTLAVLGLLTLVAAPLAAAGRTTMSNNNEKRNSGVRFTNTTAAAGGVKAVMELMHRDHPSSRLRPPGITDLELLTLWVERDLARSEDLIRSFSISRDNIGGAATVDKNGSSMIRDDWADSEKNPRRRPPYYSQPVTTSSSGAYKVDLELGGGGGPRRPLAVVMDTGSEVTWVQCQPCIQCVQQVDPIYNPFKSDTFERVSCLSPLCQTLPARTIRGCSEDTCSYGLGYGDGTITYGILGRETINFGGWSQDRVLMGCSMKTSSKTLGGAAGILALGRGPPSIITNYSPSFGNVFAYCLPRHFSADKGYLKLGRSNAAYTMPMVTNPVYPHLYFVPLEEISVDDKFLPISGNPFDIDPATGRGGVMLDSGSAFTRFPPAVYILLRDAVRNAMSRAGYPFFSPSPELETCFHLPSSDLSRVRGVPSVELHFEDGATVSLYSDNLFLPSKAATDFCFTFMPTRNQPFSIIGNAQLQGFEWSFDLKQEEIGFIPGTCRY